MRNSERAAAVTDARRWADVIESGKPIEDHDRTTIAGVVRALAWTVERYGEELERWDKNEQSLYEIALELGFTGVGLGRSRAILQVFEWAARNREAPVSGPVDPTKEDK